MSDLSQILQISKDTCPEGIDGWDFKKYILGALFYRYMSESFTTYIEGGDTSIDYKSMKDDEIPEDVKIDAIKTKGYFIYPDQLFGNVTQNANGNNDLNIQLKYIFKAIEDSAKNYPSHKNIKGLFSQFDTKNSLLGKTVTEKNRNISKVLKSIANIDISLDATKGDQFENAYKALIENYAKNKTAGKYFTPTSISKLVSKIAFQDLEKANKVYDPAAGSGSLLLEAYKEFGDRIQLGLFGQELSETTYNFARMNMFLHNMNYTKFSIKKGDTLTKPAFLKDEKFDIIITNPEYSTKWIGDNDETMINDERFSSAGVLAPNATADLAFVMHSLHYLSARGRAVIVCFPGVLYRGNAEQKIRKYLINNNFIEAVISLPSKLFLKTTISVNILVLSKNKTNTDVRFMDMNRDEYRTKVEKYHFINDPQIEEILKLFVQKTDKENVARNVSYEEIKSNNYNLSVNNYIQQDDNTLNLNIQELEDEIQASLDNCNQIRGEINQLTNLIRGNRNVSK